MKGFSKGLVTGVILSVVVIAIYFFSGVILANVASLTGISVVDYKTIDEKVDDIGDKLEKLYFEDFDRDKLKVDAIKGYVDGLGDPYTVYYTEEEFKSFTEDIDGTYEGIGAYIGYGENEKELIIVSPIDDSPAAKAGLEASDVIIKVDDKDVIGMTTDQLVKLIKGPAKTEVVLTVLRDGKEMAFNIIRDEVTIPTVKSKMLENNIGYIRLSGFDGVSYDQFVEHFDKLKKDGIDGLIIDLRFNPGGLTNIVTSIADELLPKDLVVYYTEDKAGKKDYVKTKKDSEFDKPIVVLVNEGSASASEILSGALKDYGRAKLVGTKTYGKGLVQATYFLKDGSAIKVTVAKYFTPNGNYIHGTGIKPDVEVKWPKLKEGEKRDKDFDPQLDEAVKQIKSMMK